MKVRERLKNKSLYKFLILGLKYVPICTAFIYLFNLCLNLFDYSVLYIIGLIDMSILLWVFVYTASVVFKFCACHRLFIHYVGISKFLEAFNISSTGLMYIKFWLLIIGLAIFINLFLYQYAKRN